MMYGLEAVFTRRKSFYGKAQVRQDDKGLTLVSYNTDVCRINRRGEFIRLWSGYSATTQFHINDFRQQNGLSALVKKEWEVLPVVTD